VAIEEARGSRHWSCFVPSFSFSFFSLCIILEIDLAEHYGAESPYHRAPSVEMEPSGPGTKRRRKLKVSMPGESSLQVLDAVEVTLPRSSSLARCATA